MEVYTIGFGRKSAAQFFGILRGHRIGRLLDIRLNNTSQLAGFTKREDLQFFLRELCDAEYVHEPLLAPTQTILDDYKKRGGTWAAYERDFLALLAERQVESVLAPQLFWGPTVLLCSEPSPAHCHRRLVLEYLAARWDGIEPVHL